MEPHDRRHVDRANRFGARCHHEKDDHPGYHRNDLGSHHHEEDDHYVKTRLYPGSHHHEEDDRYVKTRLYPGIDPGCRSTCLTLDRVRVAQPFGSSLFFSSVVNASTRERAY